MTYYTLPPLESPDSSWMTRSQRSRRRDKGLLGLEQVVSEELAICNMDTVLFLLNIRGLKPLLVFYFRVEEKFAGGKFRGRKISRNSIRSGYYFRGRKISRQIKIRENSENVLHAKNWCYTVLLHVIFSNEHIAGFYHMVTNYKNIVTTHC